MRPKPIKPEPGQESVWDYPRPARCEEIDKHIRVVLDGRTIAETRRAKRVLETSHPPTYYIPKEDVDMDLFELHPKRTVCEWKGGSIYYTFKNSDRIVAWAYPDPTPGFIPIKDCIGLYAHAFDECYVDGEQVQAQPGDFYGGWITKDIVGPFKGGPGTWGW